MPFQPHYRLTMSGVLFGSDERFSYGVNIARDHGNGGEDGDLGLNQGQFDDLVTAAQAFHSRALTEINPLAVLSEVKLAFITSTGAYRKDPFIAGVNTPGGGTGPTYPAQVANVVSLVTDRRGATGRGRFYLPLPTVGVENTGLSEIGTAQGVRDSAVQFINDINDEPGVDVLNIGVCVASSRGYNSRVTGVRVGRILDTMRSRRRSLPEQYSATAAVAGAGA